MGSHKRRLAKLSEEMGLGGEITPEVEEQAMENAGNEQCEDAAREAVEASHREVFCPNCNGRLKVLMFMNTQPDGVVCNNCKIWFTIEVGQLKPLAKIF